MRTKDQAERERGIGRRQLLQGLGIGAMAAGSGLPHRGYAMGGKAAAYFTHGVASGDPLQDRVILWTRVLPHRAIDLLTVFWQVAQDAAFNQVVAAGESKAQAAQDYTVKVDAIGLQPGQDYFYRFAALGVVSDIGRTKTLPVGGVEEFRLGVASCSNYPQGYFNAYRHMADSDLDLVLHLGDYLYEYPDGEYADDYALNTLGRHVLPAGEMIALEDYRTRYGVYRSDPDLQAVHQRHPFVCVWDDHEIANDTWHSGAENHSEDEGDFALRLQAARQAYHEWMPIRTPASGDQGPIYRHFAIGDLADLLMLDTRIVGRDQQLSYAADMLFHSSADRQQVPVPDGAAFTAQRLQDPSRDLLGAQQEQWLARTVADSVGRGASWQVLGQQVLMGNVGIPKLDKSAFDDPNMPVEERQYIALMQTLGDQGMPLNLDAWDGYPACRDRVTQMLADAGANTITLAGDTHNAWAFDLCDIRQRPVGVEIGTPAITSPGMESYMPGTPDELAAAMQAASPGLVSVDVSNRGWTEVTLTPEATHSRWHFVSSVLDRRFTVRSSDALTCLQGARRFS